jgi:hypothetical protein
MDFCLIIQDKKNKNTNKFSQLTPTAAGPSFDAWWESVGAAVTGDARKD